MNISIIGVGKIKEKYLKLGIDEFSKRLTKYCKLDVIELDDEKCPEKQERICATTCIPQSIGRLKVCRWTLLKR